MQYGDYSNAVRNFDNAVICDSSSPYYYCNLGVAYESSGNLDWAIINYQKALQIDPFNAAIFNSFGTVLRKKGLLNQAIDSLRKAITLKPDYDIAYYNLANALKEKGLIDESIENYKKAIKINPKFGLAYNNLGNALADKGKITTAIECFKTAISLNPNHIEAHTNLSMKYLLIKDFEKGWEEYEWRLKAFDIPRLTKPKWDGSKLNNKSILVYAEQGYGDTIQFCRFLPKLNKVYEEAKILFLPLKGLEQLLRESDLKAEILDANTKIEDIEFDTNIHLLSLPKIFKTTLENIPFRKKRYLKANKAKVLAYKQKYFMNNKLKLGIVWQGNPSLKPDCNRSMPLRHYYKLAKLPHVAIYSLQKGHGIEQLKDKPRGLKIINLGASFNDFSDTAAAIANLDLVISVDTSVAHLSAALGKKTWILLPAHYEWRWHIDMDTSPWYEDVKLYRHKEVGIKDWNEVLERACKDLKKTKHKISN